MLPIWRSSYDIASFDSQLALRLWTPLKNKDQNDLDTYRFDKENYTVSDKWMEADIIDLVIQVAECWIYIYKVVQIWPGLIYV